MRTESSIPILIGIILFIMAAAAAASDSAPAAGGMSLPISASEPAEETGGTLDGLGGDISREPGESIQDGKIIRVGVLANRGAAYALQEWGPTAEYLSRTMAPLRFGIVPLTFSDILPAAENRNVSFIITNPSLHANLEYHGLVRHIATLQVPGDPDPQPLFGGVIFTRAARDDITTLPDLAGKRFAAVDKTSLGGWQAAWYELRSAGINPERDLSELTFLMTHDAVVSAVLAGRADAGTVRSTQLERMEREGLIRLDQVKILNSRHSSYPHYPYLLSTDLYPEWSFSMVSGTDPALGKEVAVALLQMSPRDPAALACQGAGWDVSQDHRRVRELLQQLHLPPFEEFGRSSLTDVISQYWLLFIAITGGIAFLFLLLVYIWRTTQDLNRALVRAREIEEKFISIFEQTPDPIGILDAGGRIIDVNGGFQSLFGRSAAEVCGKRLSDLGLLLPVDPVQGGDIPVEGGAVSRYEIPVITRDGASFAAQVAIQRIMISNQPCLLVLIHDIDAIRRAHDAVAQANHKLKILSSITRHDILNRISITMLNTDLLRTRLRDPAQIRYLDIIDQVSGEIQSLISFTRQYESVGSDEPSWCRVEEILRSHQIRDLVPGIPIESDLGSLELYADPMIGKVFYNLVENSARHGRDLTRIRVSCVQRADELILVYEDDGGGIPSSSREFVFDQGFGENTGLGLFLIREILAITGMRISETGEGGTGVRFEIRVPAGRFRTPDL